MVDKALLRIIIVTDLVSYLPSRSGPSSLNFVPLMMLVLIGRFGLDTVIRRGCGDRYRSTCVIVPSTGLFDDGSGVANQNITGQFNTFVTMTSGI